MRWWKLSLVVVLGACAHVPPAPPAAASLGEGPDALARSVVAEVETLRGLRAKSPLRIERLAPGPFAEKLAQKELGQISDVAETEAVWIAFGFAGPHVDAQATIREVQDEQVAGFYAPKDKALYVRDPPPTSVVGPEILRGVLAHEIEHALQDSSFGAFATDLPKEDDAALARTALIEGDAMLVMVAVVAKAKGIPLDTALGNIALALSTMSPEGLARISGHSEKLLSSPLLLREALLFPYVDGLELVGSVWKAGGFQLVDEMFSHWPATTQQVMDPATYATGRRGSDVPSPALPPGWRRVSTGEMGELGTLAILETCLPRKAASAQASDWQGDRYVIGERPDGKLGLIWRVALPSPAAARRFAAALEAQQKCWDEVRGDGRGSIGPELSVQPFGSTTVLARGLPIRDFASDADVWSQPIAPPAAPVPPLGAGLVLAPIRPTELHARHGQIVGARWEDAGLGLSASLPAGFTASTGIAQVGLVLQKAGPGGGMGFYTYVASRMSDELTRQTFAGFVGGLNSSLGGGLKLEDGGGGDIDLPLGRGQERRWGLAGKPVSVRAILVPVCGGAGAVVLGSVTMDEAGAAAIEGWFHSFRVDAGAAPECPAPK